MIEKLAYIYSTESQYSNFIHLFPPKLIIRMKPQRKFIQDRKKRKNPLISPSLLVNDVS